MTLCTLLGLGHLGVGTLIQLGWTAMEEEMEGEEGGGEKEVGGESRTGVAEATQRGNSTATTTTTSSGSVGGGKKRGGRKASASRGPREKAA